MNRTLSIFTCSMLAAMIIWGCKKEDEVQLPELTTYSASEITQNSALSGGKITDYGDKNITVRGICWATHTKPTVKDSCTKGMSVETTFTSTATGLLASTTYYVRAYATGSAGTGYGNEVTFTTLSPVLPQVNGFLTRATQTTAEIYCNVEFNGGIPATCGVCWSTSENPTTSDSKVVYGTSNGQYTCTISGLTANSFYYARAYSTNEVGTAYGESIPVRTMYGTVTDVDGNEYQTVLIGTQEWMAEDLKVTHYRNGEAIPYVTSQYQWSIATAGAYCYYDLSVENLATYGALYNWYAATDSRGIAPAGWHVPSKNEVNTLIAYLGGTGVAGGKMKEAGTLHWSSPNIGASNSSGFTARGGGYRTVSQYGEHFMQIGYTGFWWTTDLVGSDLAYEFYCSASGSGANNYGIGMQSGKSIRCIRN